MINLNINHVIFLQSRKHSFQNALLGPVVGSRINTVPIAKTLGQTSPFTAMFPHIRNGIQDLQIRHRHVASLNWQEFFDNFVLCRCNFHPCILSKLVLTPPSTPTATKKQFYGTISLDPVKAKMNFATIMDEVVQQFTAKLGVNVKISVEIEANSRDGFDESMQRTVKENCNVLRFNSAQFEEESLPLQRKNPVLAEYCWLPLRL